MTQSNDLHDPNIVEVKLTHPDVQVPEYATAGAAGMDLRANIDTPIVVNGGDTALIPSGVCFNMKSPKMAGIVLPRSGLGYKHGIIMANTVGLIDSDYQGEVKIAIWNRSNTAYTIMPQDRIAQIMFMPIDLVDLKVVDSFEPSPRGANGFGSTGKQ